ncbi:YicC family protein [Joostella atrarenae]|uniref:YicC family protein n=1 Tax=Joostella atrarenae TaxID=679257 RepID=A0ABS9J029_9FLAO|nr:YicC/YloC family endoribonuclease [Joostella atrarenae]MCF8713781.1 YicC family protein [Joostella atrarenae]
MIHSMTGFGKNIIQLPSKKITVELKSLNSKNLDLNARIPSAYRAKEIELRNVIANSLERGKIDFSLFVEVTGEVSNTQVNVNVVKQYMEQLRAVNSSNFTENDDVELLKMAVRMPDALKAEREEIDEEEYKIIKNAVIEALKDINVFRAQEGAVLERDFVSRIESILSLLKQVEVIDAERLAAVRERLDRAVADIKENVDENRFEQELIYYLEKFDITEEKVRLANHLDYFLKTLNSDGSNGKKLGFISQEIGREINTIGSKANYAPMQQLVVQMKDELEKIKEQMLNVL